VLDLTGKTAIVTGAGSIGPGWGNGKAMAVLFARQGAKVFGIDINPAAASVTGDIIQREGHSSPIAAICLRRKKCGMPWMPVSNASGRSTSCVLGQLRARVELQRLPCAHVQNCAGALLFHDRKPVLAEDRCSRWQGHSRLGSPMRYRIDAFVR